ncbi:hypothetical protein M501DRAFT_997254 [Patellaria atrata CBS 101060]|uniref:Heterokaryon incompatibility domain-containing protein n=1 Tax=Patellaria atrata CBS 101060 TaxID=1346257 RepID=A0A9P4S680_9PEZI|nr:hypothetical protein M501DRAFT_997254 [Patellaria atrata CBS 101060]
MLKIQPTASDKGDWEKEARVMGEVYQKSLCTIAACIGDSCDGNLFTLRKAAKICPQSCLVAENSEMERGIHLKPHSGYWYANVETSTLSKRGWVLQERLLAPRTVFCTRDGFFWECKKINKSDANDENPPTYWDQWVATPKLADLVKNWRSFVKEREFPASGKISTKKSSFMRQCFTRKITKREVVARPWYEIVYNFTRRDLTYATDRLPAVAGIASSLSAWTGDKYAGNAGIWLSDLIGGLAWYRGNGNSESTRLQNAPSWSWASVTAPIDTLLKRTDHVTNIAQVNTQRTVTTTHQNGGVSVHQLHLRGPICWIRIRMKPIDGIFRAIHHVPGSAPQPIPEKQWPRFSNPASRSAARGASGLKGASNSFIPFGYDTEDHEVVFDVSTDNPEIGTEFMCLAIVHAGFLTSVAQVYPMALVLAPVDVKRKVYKRIGWCFMWADILEEDIREDEIVLV